MTKPTSLSARRPTGPAISTFRLLGIGLVLAIVGGVAAQENPGIELTLEDALELALHRNLGLQVQSIEPAIEAEGVVVQEAAFDPNLFSRASIGQSELSWIDGSGNARQTTSDNRSYALGINKRIVTGAQVSASASLNRSDGTSFNPELNQLVGGGLSERATLGIDITQPLLRDRGRDANLAPLRRAQSQLRASAYQLRNSIFDLVANTESAYWRLADAHARRGLRQSNLDLSLKLVDEAQERHRLGLATRLEVLQAEANLAQRREDIIRAEQAIADAADALLATVGALEESSPEAPPIEVLPLPAPSFDRNATFDQVLQLSFERNFDTIIQEEILQQLEQDVLVAKNNTRSELDVTLSAGYSGLSAVSGRDAFEEALDRRGDNWGLGLSFNLPWGKRAGNANLSRAALRLDQAEIQLAAIKQDLLQEVRSAWRSADLTRQQLEAARLVVELQQAAYEQEQGLFEEGLSTLRDVLETQRDLDTANIGLLDAQLAAIDAEVRLARVEGSLLDRHGLSWDAESIPETRYTER